MPSVDPNRLLREADHIYVRYEKLEKPNPVYKGTLHLVLAMNETGAESVRAQLQRGNNFSPLAEELAQIIAVRARNYAGAEPEPHSTAPRLLHIGGKACLHMTFPLLSTPSGRKEVDSERLCPAVKEALQRALATLHRQDEPDHSHDGVFSRAERRIEGIEGNHRFSQECIGHFMKEELRRKIDAAINAAFGRHCA